MNKGAAGVYVVCMDMWLPQASVLQETCHCPSASHLSGMQVFDEELAELEQRVRLIAAAGADAVTVQVRTQRTLRCVVEGVCVCYLLFAPLSSHPLFRVQCAALSHTAVLAVSMGHGLSIHGCLIGQRVETGTGAARGACSNAHPCLHPFTAESLDRIWRWWSWCAAWRPHCPSMAARR